MRLLRIVLLALGGQCALLAACGAVAMADESADEQFRAHVGRVFDEMWREFPELAVRMGNYKYADQLTVPDRARRERSVAFYERHLAALKAFDAASLSPSNRVDLELMRNRFERNRWYVVTFRSWQWQPSMYNVGPDLDLALDTEYAPLDVRLRHTLARLDKVPAYYAAAQASVADPTPEHIELALRQNKGALRLFGDDLMNKVDASGLNAEEKTLFRRRAEASMRSRASCAKHRTAAAGRAPAASPAAAAFLRVRSSALSRP